LENNMSNGKPCEAHHIPADICGPCKSAAEERQRIIELIEKSFPEEFRAYRANIIKLISTLT